MKIEQSPREVERICQELRDIGAEVRESLVENQWEVRFVGNRFTDYELSIAARLKGLCFVLLRDTGVSTGGIDLLSKCSLLSQLFLWNVDEELVRTSLNLKTLRKLQIRSTPASDSAFANLHQLEQLEELDLYSVDLNGFGLSYIGQLDRLRILSIIKAPLTDLGLRYIAQLPCLQELNLSHTLVTDEGVAFLENHPCLRQLGLGSTALTDKGLKSIATIGDLTHLSVPNTHVTNAGMEYVGQLKDLVSLTLYDTAVNGQGLAPLVGLYKLHAAPGWNGSQVSDFEESKFLMEKSLASVCPESVVIRGISLGDWVGGSRRFGVLVVVTWAGHGRDAMRHDRSPVCADRSPWKIEFCDGF